MASASPGRQDARRLFCDFQQSAQQSHLVVVAIPLASALSVSRLAVRAQYHFATIAAQQIRGKIAAVTVSEASCPRWGVDD